MEAVVLIGLQGSGKSSFCQQHLADTHVRINLDMLRTRSRESILFEACLKAKQPCVIDNTNPTRAERQRYIAEAKAAGFAVHGYYFQSQIEACKRRNAARDRVVPLPGLLGTYNRLEAPVLSEGFDKLYYVKLKEPHGFAIEEWKDEV